MPKPIGTGSLFVEDAHQRFMRLTLSRYNNMMARLVKKKLIDKDHPPFTCEQYRAQLLTAMNGKEDGFVQCRYCRGYFNVVDLASDHAIPLDRRGSIGLDNIEFPCRGCNDQKGKMTPDDFLKLLAFLETLPLARVDILHRLQMAVQLAAGQRSNAPIINELKERGDWKNVQNLRRQRKRDKESGLGEF